MGRRKAGSGESSYRYFKKLFAERPDWVDQKSNVLILERYRADHNMAPDAEVDPRVKNNMANLKSNLRKKNREEGGTKVSTVSVKAGANSYDALEELIDDCIVLARNTDKEKLEGVIAGLRHARRTLMLLNG